jgi:hypothetical protein
MPQLDDFSRDYLRLVLEIDKHIGGYVDSYYGPPELKAQVESHEKLPPMSLLERYARLCERVPSDDPQRREYLDAVLRALQTTLRTLNGDRFDYLEEVNRLYDIRPQLADESTFTRAHADLDTLLPGSGLLADRLEAWRKPYEVPAERLLDVLEIVRAEVRRRTAALFDLVQGESIEFTLTQSQPWSAYNWYKGSAHSLIEFNTDIPISALDLAGLFAHEGYPGHHTEHQLKEQHLYQERGWGEVAAALLHSPSAVIAEGIATTAVEIIFPDGAHHDWTAEVLLPAAGLPPADPAVLRRVGTARDAVSPNAAILHHTGRLDPAQTVDYYRAYALMTDQRAQRSYRFITDPLFRAYVFTYTEGYALIEQAARGRDKMPIFTHLLHEEVLPSRLAAL